MKTKEKNMEVQIVLADNIETTANQAGGTGINNVINPTLVFGLPVMPSALSFSVIVLTKGIDSKIAHNLNFKIVNSDGKEVSNISGNILAQTPSPIGTFNFNLNFRNVLFETDGIYKVLFSMDGEQKGEQAFEVKDISISK